MSLYRERGSINTFINVEIQQWNHEFHQKILSNLKEEAVASPLLVLVLCTDWHISSLASEATSHVSQFVKQSEFQSHPVSLSFRVGLCLKRIKALSARRLLFQDKIARKQQRE